LQQVQQLSPSVLVEIVGHAVRNVKENKVFAERLKIELSNYLNQEVQLKEDRNELSAIKTIFEGYTRNGDTGKFYGKYYAKVAAKSTQFFTHPAQQIFLKAECHFRQFTSETDLQRLDISGITHKATSDSDILTTI